MKSFIEFINEFRVVPHIKRVKTIKSAYKAKDPTPPKETDWPPFSPPPKSTTNSLDITC